VADKNDVRRIAATPHRRHLPETEVDIDGAGQLKVTFRGKLLAWTWLERHDPKGPRVPNPSVLALRDAWRLRAPQRMQQEHGM
jgi:hypothetical protein